MSRFKEQFNSSGYYDPTAYVAIQCAALAEKQQQKKSLRKKADDMTQIYIASPFKGYTKLNVKNALRYCRFAVKQGYFPIAPHCYLPRFMNDDDPDERELALSFGLRLMKNCVELWVFGDKITDGMRWEIKAAETHGIIIRRFNENMEELRYE